MASDQLPFNNTNNSKRSNFAYTKTSSQAAAVIDYILDDRTEQKLKDLFDFFDIDGNGLIQREELFKVLALCAHDIGLEMDAYLEQIVETVFSYARLNQAGSITFDGLKEVLRRRPNLINELSLAKKVHENAGLHNRRHDTYRGITNYLANYWELTTSSLAKWIPIFNKLRWEYISNNLVRFNFFLFIFFTSLILFSSRIYSYWGQCGFLIWARASGQCLNFFCSAIVLLVCRRSISLLRSNGFGRYLPLDDHIYFHKMFGLFIVGHSFSHALGHLFNFYIESRKEGSPSLAEYLFGVHLGIGWIGGCASLTGWLLLIIILVMASAQPFSRSLGKFELFYYTHLLYIPFWALLFIHASNYWLWFLGPFLIFTIESLIRLRNLLTNLTSEGQTTIIKAIPLPSNVIHLVIKRPPNFEYKPGDWIYVLIPQIAKYEWHPFTISSAPEQEGVIWLHIRAIGEWTRRLRSYFEDLEHRNHLSRFIRSGQFSISMDQFNGDLSPYDSSQVLAKSHQPMRAIPSLATIHEHSSYELLPSIEQRSDSKESSGTESFDTCSSGSKSGLSTTRITRQMPNITIFIDGPYGSPSSQIFRAEHAVLIATGIGVTPFASILQSIVQHYEKRRQKCPSCACEFIDNRPPILCKLRKVDFVWINRDQKSFEWFIKLLAELELTQSQLPPNERFLDIHIHLTAIEPAQTKSIGLQLALYLIHEKNKKDLVTGLRTRTKAGRPNWDEFFRKIRDQKKGKVSVFFCGRPQLGRLLHRQCDSFGFKFRKEIF